MICTRTSPRKNKAIRTRHVIRVLIVISIHEWRLVNNRKPPFLSPFYPPLVFCLAGPPVSTPFLRVVGHVGGARHCLIFGGRARRTGLPLSRRILIDDKCPFQFRHCFRGDTDRRSKIHRECFHPVSQVQLR